MANDQELPPERKQYHLHMLEALPVAIYTTDAAGKITFYQSGGSGFRRTASQARHR